MKERELGTHTQGEEVNTCMCIQERRHLPFSNSIRIKKQRETFDKNAHNLHKALSNREREKEMKKVDISTKIFLSW